MFKNFSINFLYFSIITIFISGCGGNSKNYDLDLSDYTKPVKKLTINANKVKKPKEEKKDLELKLISLDKKDKIVSSMKYGKKDPFSTINYETAFSSKLKLKGFISFKNTDFALVEYQGQEGIISIDSVGEINTKLLPSKATVKKIIPSQDQIFITFEGEDYPILLTQD